MNRTEVHLGEIDGKISFNLRRAPIGGTRISQQFLGCDETCASVSALGQPMLPQGAVRQVGEHLLGLLNQHPRVKMALQKALTAPNNQVETLYLLIDSPSAEALPWETLFDPANHFLALDRRWPVVRAMEPENTFAPSTRVMPETVRFALLMSAQGTPALLEWTRIWQKLSAAPFPIDVLLLVGEEAVFDSAAALNDPRLHVEYVGNATSLFTRLSGYAPHFLHLFCHGTVANPPYFQVAQRNDHVMGQPGYTVEVGHLTSFVPQLQTDLWLATLDVCQSAAGNAAGYSMASSLVTLGGLPAVIGMRELVRGADTSVFAGALYEGIVQRLQTLRALSGQTMVIEWGELMQPPRHLLAQQVAGGNPIALAAADAKEWTQPVLYVRREDFQVNIPAAKPASVPAPGSTSAPAAPPPERSGLSDDERAMTKAQLDVLADFRRSLASSTPASVIQDIDARIQLLRAQLGLD